MAESSIHLEEALGRDPKAAKAIISKLNTAKSDFSKNLNIALNASKLPKPVSKDKKRIAIAGEILKNPKSEFGQYATIILITDEIIERESKYSELDIDDAEITLGGDLKMSGTETTWTYKWEEFKFGVHNKFFLTVINAFILSIKNA